MARYQPSLGRALGKWLLSLSTNSRLYWPDSLPSDQQTGNASDPRDPNGTLPYEAARHCLYFRPEHKCLTGAAAGPIGTGDVHELLNGASSPFAQFVHPCLSMLQLASVRQTGSGSGSGSGFGLASFPRLAG